MPVLIDFWGASGVGLAKHFLILEELASEMSDKLLIAKVNLDENQDLAMKFSIRSIPFLLLFKSGKLIDTKVSMSKNELSEWINSQINYFIPIFFKTISTEYNEPHIITLPPIYVFLYFLKLPSSQ